ncbi:MAG: hypothetical protein NDF54_01430 [archaeon GB-1867-035]|nr:hypothetical protein [Candidatus Culexmicrobium profundum]
MSEQLLLIVAAIIIFSYLYKYHLEERRREQSLLVDIKANLLPVLTRNLNSIASTLDDEEKLLKKKVRLEDVFNKDLSVALFVDFKQHFYETGLRLSEFRKKLSKFDDIILKSEVGLDELKNIINKLKVEIKQLLEKLEELKKVEKLPPRKFGLK